MLSNASPAPSNGNFSPRRAIPAAVSASPSVFPAFFHLPEDRQLQQNKNPPRGKASKPVSASFPSASWFAARFRRQTPGNRFVCLPPGRGAACMRPAYWESAGNSPAAVGETSFGSPSAVRRRRERCTFRNQLANANRLRK